uniref:Uncharacterized protein n=1 Tax=Wuchereria bancrofti TaxID=6293 RepID=A0AAF5PPR9_WUCBA
MRLNISIGYLVLFPFGINVSILQLCGTIFFSCSQLCNSEVTFTEDRKTTSDISSNRRNRCAAITLLSEITVQSYQFFHCGE